MTSKDEAYLKIIHRYDFNRFQITVKGIYLCYDYITILSINHK